MPGRNRKGEITFADYPEFRPNMSPKEMFKAGSFGALITSDLFLSQQKALQESASQRPKVMVERILEHHLTN